MMRLHAHTRQDAFCINWMVPKSLCTPPYSTAILALHVCKGLVTFTATQTSRQAQSRITILGQRHVPAADTKNDVSFLAMQVLSDDHSSAEEQPSPTKKTCLHPGPSNNQDSLHRQPSPRAREHTIREMNAPEQFAEKVSARRPGTLLSSDMGVTQPAAAATQNGRAETDDGEAIPSAQIMQKQPSIAVPKIQTEKAAERIIKERNPKGAADKYLGALIEGKRPNLIYPLQYIGATLLAWEPYENNASNAPQVVCNSFNGDCQCTGNWGCLLLHTW